MLAVAVEWEIYRRTHSATALGLVGLVFAIPIVGLSLPAGHLADRISRKHIILVSQIFSSVTSALLALVSWQHLAIPQMSILQRRIARKFHVGQAGAAEIKLIGPNRVRGEKIVSAGRSYDVVLIYAVAANTDRADQDAVLI